MYKKSVQGWLKHLDFMILDVVCLWISFTLAFNMRHGSLDVLANSLYRDMMWSLALMDIVVIFFFDSLKNVLKRGFYQEFVMTVKQTCLITLCSVFYLFTFKEAEELFKTCTWVYSSAVFITQLRPALSLEELPPQILWRSRKAFSPYRNRIRYR